MNRKPVAATQFLKRELNINRGKNIFSEKFADSILCTGNYEKLIIELNGIDPNLRYQLLNDIVEHVIKEFCLVNQYYHIGTYEKRELQYVYAALLDNLVGDEKKMQPKLDGIRKSHLNNLRNWLRKSNPWAEELYPSEISRLEFTPCAEYSGQFQLKLFGLDINAIKHPVLDIGCGEKQNLIKHLRGHNIQAYGFDRFKSDTSDIEEADWLTHEYGQEKWGTIISNMSFSNHFHHHHLRKDGKYKEYAQCYMRILQSLQKGGAFFYAPHLPFIENLLHPSLYKINKSTLQGSKFKVTKVERLK